MKRLLSLLLILCLTLTAAATAESAGTQLPRVGDVVHGFELTETRDYPLVDAVILRFVHQKTGAELYYVANDDTNRAFDLAFRTEAIDNTGLPHVFEHATIQGSKAFPGEQMFFNASYQTYNTFMNAMTGQWDTSYPLASLSEKQLLALAEYYTDACFYPAIMENERIYRTEAWRYRMETPEDDLTIEGTVYSEMLGALTLEGMAGANAIRAAFPGSMVGNISGGDPDYIPDMTWQMLKDYHDTYYHPSNAIAYLYGQFEDYAAFLALLDSYFSQFDRREFLHDDPGYTPLAESVTISTPYPTEQGSNTEHASTIHYIFICPGLKDDTEENNRMNTLTDLLIHNASALNQRIQETFPYAGFGCYINQSGPESSIYFLLNHADPEDAQTFKTIVDEALADVAENGFPQELVDSVSTSLEISAKLIRETSDPVNNVLTPMMDYYIATGNPWGYPDYQDGLFSMDEWNRQGLYAQGVSRWLLNDAVTVLSTTYPEPGAKEAHDAATAERLAALKASMTDAEIAAIVEATNAEAPEDQTAESVARLKVVTVEDLPEELQTFEVRDETDENGIRHIDAPAAVEGISHANIFLDAAGLPQDDIHWFVLYTDLLGQLDTAAHTKAELAGLMNRYLYSGSIRLSLPRDGGDGCHPYLRMGWIGLDDDLAQGYDLMRELLFDTRMDDPAKLIEQVEALRAGMKAEITADPANTLVTRGLARGSARYAYSSYAGGLDYYAFLGEVERLLKDDPDAAMARLEGIRTYFNNRANAVTLCAGNEASIALNRRLSDAFLAALDEREIIPAEYDFPIPEKREALIIDSGIQYNMVVGGLNAVGLEDFDGSLSALNALTTDTFLVPLLRDRYGVYTPEALASEDYFMFYAYRDPNIAETFETLEQLPDLIREMALDQDTLDGYIMNAYSDYAMPVGALSGPVSAALDRLQGLDPARRLDWMRQLKALTPEAVRTDAGLYAKLLSDGARLTAGAASAINQNAGLYDAILNPFGAVDKTQTALADAVEGDPHYGAVRFAFEKGLMAPLDETTFGVDAPASRGDLLAAVNALIGGACDPEEALTALAGYGLVPADTDLGAALPAGEIQSLLAALTGSEVAPLVEPARPDAVTRGELAEALMAFSNGIE